MEPPVSPLPSAIPEMFAQVSVSGKLTLADRYGIMAALLTESLSQEEIYALDRLLYALRKGQVQMVNELSIVVQPSSAL